MKCSINKYNAFTTEFAAQCPFTYDSITFIGASFCAGGSLNKQNKSLVSRGVDWSIKILHSVILPIKVLLSFMSEERVDGGNLL